MKTPHKTVLLHVFQLVTSNHLWLITLTTPTDYPCQSKRFIWLATQVFYHEHTEQHRLVVKGKVMKILTENSNYFIFREKVHYNPFQPFRQGNRMRRRVIRNHFSNQSPQGDDNSCYGCQKIQVKSLGKIYTQDLLFFNSKIYEKMF